MWVRKGKRREMGLGAYPAVSLAKARQKAAECRNAVQDGRDPIAEKAKEAEPTFGECAERYVKSIAPEWRNVRHRRQWTQTLTDYCLFDSRQAGVGGWHRRHPQGATAYLASQERDGVQAPRQDRAGARLRQGQGLADWREPRAVARAPAEHPSEAAETAAGPLTGTALQDVPAFLLNIRAARAMAARALEFTVLTVTRTGEALGAKWSEIDIEAKIWAIPKERTKAGRGSFGATFRPRR